MEATKELTSANVMKVVCNPLWFHSFHALRIILAYSGVTCARKIFKQKLPSKPFHLLLPLLPPYISDGLINSCTLLLKACSIRVTFNLQFGKTMWKI